MTTITIKKLAEGHVNVHITKNQANWSAVAPTISKALQFAGQVAEGEDYERAEACCEEVSAQANTTPMEKRKES